MKLFHPAYNSDVFSAVESRKEFDAYEDIIVGKDPESTRHRCLAGWELARIRRTNPSALPRIAEQTWKDSKASIPYRSTA
jgi:hypothetical protein